MLDEVKSCVNAEYAHLIKRLQGGQADLFQEDLFQLGATRAILTSSSDMLARRVTVEGEHCRIRLPG